MANEPSNTPSPAEAEFISMLQKVLMMDPKARQAIFTAVYNELSVNPIARAQIAELLRDKL